MIIIYLIIKITITFNIITSTILTMLMALLIPLLLLIIIIMILIIIPAQRDPQIAIAQQAKARSAAATWLQTPRASFPKGFEKIREDV